jgi:signal transduction histidine kinase
MAKKPEDKNQFKVVDAIIAMVSHDLRNPLHSIHMSASLIAQDSSDPKIHQRVDGIHRAVNSMTRMIGTLLDAGRINAGKLPINKSQVDATQDVLEVVEEFLPIAEYRKLKLDVEIPERPIWVNYDSDRIQQVLGNLVANALKYATSESTIHIIVSRDTLDPKMIRFEVRNKGDIIPPAHRRIIFERFAHLERSRMPTDPESIGLGLWIADWIVTEHRGHIWVEETVTNDGNRFCFILPRDVPDSLV